MSDDYSLHTKKNYLETRRDIVHEMSLWGITDYLVEQKGNGAKVTYIKNGKTVDLSMDKQATAKDNLRVLYLAIRSIRLNEVRGISDVIESAYLQLAGPATKRDPFEILGIRPDASLEFAEQVYKLKVKEAHPDRGGTVEKMTELNQAMEELRQRLK